MGKKQTDAFLELPIRIAHHTLLFVVVGAAPLAVFQTFTHAIQPNDIFSLYGTLLPAWYTLLVLLVLLRAVMPKDLRQISQTTAFTRALNALFAILSAVFFALFTFLFMLAARDTFTAPIRPVDVLVTLLLFSANLAAFAWLTRYYALSLLPKKRRVVHRSFSDWFFDNVEMVVKQVQKLPFITR